MKLSALISYHYIVYTALVLLLSTSRLNQSSFTAKVCKAEEVKTEASLTADTGKVLHSELLYRY